MPTDSRPLPRFSAVPNHHHYWAAYQSNVLWAMLLLMIALLAALPLLLLVSVVLWEMEARDVERLFTSLDFALGALVAVMLGLLWTVANSIKFWFFPAHIQSLESGLAGVRFWQPPTPAVLILADEAPELYALIEQVRRKLHAPPVHAVYLSRDADARVIQLVQWHDFLPPRNELYLGLAVFDRLTPVQLEALIARELTHLRLRHPYLLWCARYHHWRWEQARQRLSVAESPAVVLYWLLVSWQLRTPKSWKSVQTLYEYQADAGGAHCTSPAIMAETLSRLWGDEVEAHGFYATSGAWRDYLDGTPQPVVTGEDHYPSGLWISPRATLWYPDKNDAPYQDATPYRNEAVKAADLSGDSTSDHAGRLSRLGWLYAPHWKRPLAPQEQAAQTYLRPSVRARLKFQCKQLARGA